MSSEYQIKTILLGLRRLRGPHSKENITKAVLSIINKYKLTSNRIKWFILDNVSSNNVYITEILKALNINDTIRRRRLRCLGHIINLSTKAFLFSSDPEVLKRDTESAEQYEEKKEREI
jgi:hypothetical protein